MTEPDQGGPDDDYDPTEGLSYLEKVKVDYDLASKKITPFDNSDYIQVMLNPKYSRDNDEELITV
jgi:hypothetical protein